YICLMLTPLDWTLALHSATRSLVCLAAWIPLSVNCTKLMYVAMILLLQLIIGSFWADEIKRKLRPAIRGSNVDRNTRRLCATRNRSLIAASTHQTLRLRIGRGGSPNRPQTSHCPIPAKKCRSKRSGREAAEPRQSQAV